MQEWLPAFATELTESIGETFLKERINHTATEFFRNIWTNFHQFVEEDLAEAQISWNRLHLVQRKDASMKFLESHDQFFAASW